MTDVDIDLVKFKAHQIWDGLAPDVQGIFQRLFEKYPNDVITELSAGAVTDAARITTLAEWIGDTSGPPASRYPYVRLIERTQWQPYHPDANADVTITWTELNQGVDLGPYTDSVDIRNASGEVINTIKVDCEGLAQGESAQRGVSVAFPADDTYTVIITANEDGAIYGREDPTAQGFQSNEALLITVGGADVAPVRDRNEVRQIQLDPATLRDSLSQSLQALNGAMAGDNSVLTTQQFGAGLYYLSYVPDSVPSIRENSQDSLMRANAAELYRAGDEYYNSRLFENNETGEGRMELFNATQTLLPEVQSLIALCNGLQDNPQSIGRLVSAINQTFDVAMKVVAQLKDAGIR